MNLLLALLGPTLASYPLGRARFPVTLGARIAVESVLTLVVGLVLGYTGASAR